MPKINFRYGSTVYYENTAYNVVDAAGLTKVKIRHQENGNTLIVPIGTLTSKPTEDNIKLAIDDYTEDEWSTGLRYERIILPLYNNLQNTTQDVRKIAETNNMSVSNIYRLLKLYGENPTPSALIPMKRHRGSSKNRLPEKTNQIIDEMLEEYYLHRQKYSFKRIYQKIKSACADASTMVPHENTVRNRIKKIDPMLAMKRRENYKSAMTAYSNFEGEFKDGNYPLDFYQIDHTPLDIILVDEVTRKPVGRPILTVAIDIYSRMIAGFYLSFEGPGYFNVGQCLYRAFTTKDKYLKSLSIDGEWPIYGTPRVIGVDNGAELVGTEVQRLCEEYGISLEKRPVARPQFGGHVERVIGTINKEVHNLPGATFSNIQERGSYDAKKEASMSINELEKWLTEYIVNIYHKTYHHGIENTPFEQYRFGIEEDEDNPQVGIIPSMLVDDETIYISLLPTFYRTVQRNGITLEDITYYADTLRQFINRTGEDGKKIQLKIKRDPMDISKIYVYDPKNKFYLEVPYRKVYAPAMNIWELQAIKRYFKENRISKFNETDIFRTYQKLEEIEKNAKAITRQAKRKQTPVTEPSDTVIPPKKIDKPLMKPKRSLSDIRRFNIVDDTHKNENGL